MGTRKNVPWKKNPRKNGPRKIVPRKNGPHIWTHIFVRVVELIDKNKRNVQIS